MIGKEHKSRTLGGLKWNIVNQLINQTVQLLVSIILARLLSPKDFGLIGMIMVFLGFLQVFRDFGLGSALIQKSEISEVELSTVFWTNLFFGFVLSIVVILTSGFVGTFYRNESLKSLIAVMSLNFIIQAFNYVQSTLLRKELGFQRLFGINLFSTFASGGIAIWMAFSGYQAWSIVAQTIVGNLVNTVILWSISNWRPRFVFSLSELNALMRFSLPLMGTQTLHYWNRNADNLLVGKLLGEAALGSYTRAYSLMLFPVKQVSAMLSAVMFPSIALIQHDISRIGEIYIKSVRILSLITIPLMGLLFVVADQFVHTILGSKWHEAVPIIRILSGVGAMQSISTLNGNIFLGLGKTRLQLRLNLILSFLIVVSIAIGVLFGLSGVAYGYLISTLLSGFVLRIYIGQLINLKVIDLVRPIIPSLILSVIAVVLISLVKENFHVPSTSFLALAYVSVSYVCLILLLFFLFVRKELEFALSMFKQLIKSK